MARRTEAVEQLASLRLTPNFSTRRPCDPGVVKAAVGKLVGERQHGPTALILATESGAGGTHAGTGNDCFRGGYILKDSGGGKPDIIRSLPDRKWKLPSGRRKN